MKEKKDNVEDEKELETHICPHDGCEKTYSMPWQCNDHYRKSHLKKQCPECGKVFSSNFFRKHMANTHNKLQKDFFCDKCGKAFFEKYLLENHEEVEHKGQRFRCRYPECKSDQEYRDASNRTAHERSKHGDTYNKFLSKNNK